MSAPTVSVIMPAFNSAQFIEETLRSVTAQTRGDFEVLVMDDGSTDDTAKVVARLGDPRIVYHARPHTGLPSTGRNFGIRNSRGMFVAFLDSDDLWKPNKLEVQLAQAQAHPEAGLFYARAQRFRDNGQRELQWLEGSAPAGAPFRALLFLNFIPTSSVLIPRRVLDDVGVFDETPSFRAAEDYDLWLRIARRYTFEFTPEVLSMYRVHGQNISQLNAEYFNRWTSILDKTLNTFPVNPILALRARANVHFQRFRYEIRKRVKHGLAA